MCFRTGLNGLQNCLWDGLGEGARNILLNNKHQPNTFLFHSPWFKTSVECADPSCASLTHKND